MKRRTFFKIGAAASIALNPSALRGASAETCSALPGDTPSDATASGDVFIPGYWPGAARYKGGDALDHPHLARAVPKSYKGPVRLLTRLGLDGDVAQALFPVHGHNVEVSPDGKIGFFGSMEYRSYVCFDPKTLDLITLGKPYRKDWVGGGHGVFVNQGAHLALTERAPRVGYRGSPEKHFGRVTLREPDTLKIIESHSTHGISPHDVRLLADGKHLAIANYGSTYPRRKRQYGVPRHVVEPSVTVIDIDSGRLAAKYASGSSSMELRHLCAHDFDTIFAIQTVLGLGEQDAAYHRSDPAAYAPDLTTRETESYLPAPILRVERASQSLRPLGSTEMQKLMRQGLSIHYEPTHQEIIATFPSTHAIMVFDAASGDLKHHIDGRTMGLEYPCGLVLLKDPRYYVVAGYWKNLFVFERGSHRLMRELCHYTTFFGHSHITAA
ncbi:MAG: DUF1513 domain-containing protein [Alphaproteobacteria bacterium]|nr:DUF1513 domain-containing protein [Alphaproteobacteria bacterium]